MEPTLVAGLGLSLGILLAAIALVVLAWNARGAVLDERDKRHAAEMLLRDATERSLRAELAAERKNAALGAAAGKVVVDGAAALAGAPPGLDGDLLLLGGDPAAARAGGRPPVAPGSAS